MIGHAAFSNVLTSASDCESAAYVRASLLHSKLKFSVHARLDQARMAKSSGFAEFN